MENKEIKIKIFQGDMLNILFTSVFSLALIFGGLYANYKFFTDIYVEQSAVKSLLFILSVVSTVFVPQIILWMVFCVNICNQIDHMMYASNLKK